MKVESCLLSDNEFLWSVEMFVTERFDKGSRRLVSIEYGDRDSFVDSPPSEFEPIDILRMCDEFFESHNSVDSHVYEVWCMGEFCGLISFSDWQ